MGAARARVAELDAELATFGGDERARARELDLARFQLAELDAAAVDDPDEDSVLDVLEDTLASAVDHRAAGATAYEMLAGDGGARDALASAAAALAGRAPYRVLADRLADMLVELDDVGSTVRDTVDQIADDPERLDEVRARRQLLHDLRRKYGDTLVDVQRFHREVAERVDSLEGYEQRAAEIDEERQRAIATAEAEADAVLAARREAAPRFGAAVTERLKVLAMPDAVVDVHVESLDDVRFLLSANPGMPLLPLSKVASGGELARTMLALRLVTIGNEEAARWPAEVPPSTLVFDEVDAGIGGIAATAVGDSLAAVGTIAPGARRYPPRSGRRRRRRPDRRQQVGRRWRDGRPCRVDRRRAPCHRSRPHAVGRCRRCRRSSPRPRAPPPLTHPGGVS